MEAATHMNDGPFAGPGMDRQRHEFLFETEQAGISFADFQRALERLPYGSTSRVALQLLAATGCRITELDRMDPGRVLDGFLYWRPGKNQKGLRREFLPQGLRDELVAYRASHRVKTAFLLGIESQTIVRNFDRDDRPSIGGSWGERSEVFLNGRGWGGGWRLHLKGFRKTFQTVLFAHFYRKYGDANVALEWVSKRMKHSSKHITAYHYLQDYEKLDVNRWVEWLETGRAPQQSRIYDFMI